MRRTWLTPSLLTLALAAWPAGAAAAGEHDQAGALGHEGEVYRVVQGQYNSLFGSGGEESVLALDVLWPDRRERYLVPGTSGPNIELFPSVTFEPSSATLYLVWTSHWNFLHSQIHLVGYRSGGFTDLLAVSGDPFSDKSAPRVVITRDDYRLHPDGPGLERTVLHTFWLEENGLGTRTAYAPLLLLDGEFVGPNRVLSLHELAGQSPYVLAPDALSRLVVVRAGAAPGTLVAATSDPDTRELRTVRLSVLPGAISLLAEDARAHIIEVGARACAQGGAAALAEKARAHIIEVGRALRTAVVEHLANQTYAVLLAPGTAACGAAGVSAVAERARAHIIEVGVKAAAVGLLATQGPTALHSLVDDGPAEAPGQVLEVALERVLPSPNVGEAELELYLSADGSRLLAAWAVPGALAYRESTDDGWTEVRKLVLDSHLSLAGARSVLAQRVEER